MARRHPMRGCDCVTCVNGRLYQLRPEVRARKNASERARYREMTQEQYERKLATNRAAERRYLEAKDQARLAALQGDDE